MRRPYCQKCEKSVEQVRVYYDHDNHSRLLELTCHGETKNMTVPSIERVEIGDDDEEG